jgi:hypothetical protein
MKVSDWKEMLNKLDDNDELCIARPSQDFGIIRVNYNKPNLVKKQDVDKTWELQEVNKFPDDNADYLIY